MHTLLESPAVTAIADSDELLQRCEAQANQPRDQRCHRRLRGRQVKVVLADQDGKRIRTEGWIIDRSQGGLGIAVNTPLPAGTVFSVRALKLGEGTWVKIEVRNCRPQGDNWVL